MEENNWQTIWNKRNTQINNFDMLSDKQIILELKRLNGYDVTESKITYESFIEEFDNIIKYLNLNLKRFQTGALILFLKSVAAVELTFITFLNWA